VLDVIPEKDVMAPPDARNRYRDDLGADRVTVTVVPDAGHALLPEQPEAVAKAVIEYLKRLG
jgi:pimeloyl-ACP methyl ester carboxylesterase